MQVYTGTGCNFSDVDDDDCNCCCRAAEMSLKSVIGGTELLKCITLASMQDNASATGLSLP